MSANLPSEDEYSRLRQAGHTALMTVPDSAVPEESDDPTVFDALQLAIVQEALEQAFGLLEEAEHLTAEISILSSGAVPTSAETMFLAALDAAGSLGTTRGTQQATFQAVLAMKEPISRFQAAVRDELGVTVPTAAGARRGGMSGS
ncbi:hypothetical protein ACSYGO_16510 [Streptomyces krungchingensis]